MIYIISKQKNERDLFRALVKTEIVTTEIPKDIPPGDKLFFYHYSHKIPPEIYENYECIGFHMSDLPFGRGGSPIQNQISCGFEKIKLTAFRTTGELDAGPIYLKMPISLSGTADEILRRGIYIAVEMIRFILDDDIKPIPQEGEAIYFKRRAPSESLIHTNIRILPHLYDHIRMLDGEGYPKAYFKYSKFRFEFSGAVLKDDKLIAVVEITEAK